MTVAALFCWLDERLECLPWVKSYRPIESIAPRTADGGFVSRQCPSKGGPD